MAKTAVPAVEGWFTTEGPEPALLGQRCTGCGTYVFPRATVGCPNPSCRSTAFDTVPLSRRGTIWSYTDARYRPPPPYVAGEGDHEPFTIAAVELREEQLVVLGQMVPGVRVEDLTIGDEVEVVIESLFSDDVHDHLVWKWKPLGSQEAIS